MEDKIYPPIAPKAGVNGHAYFRVQELALGRNSSQEIHLPGAIPVKSNGNNTDPAANDRSYCGKNNGALNKIPCPS